MCVLIFSTTFSEKFLIIRRIQRDSTLNVRRSSSKVVVIRYSSHILMHLNFLNIFSKNKQISNSIKIHPVTPGSFQADGRTDGETDSTKPIFSFRNFVNASEKGYLQYPYDL